MPPISVHWVKNNVLAAAVSAVVGLSIFFVRHVTGATDADVGVGMLLFHVVAIGLWAFLGAATGVLTGAVLQRILPSLPTRTWIALHVVLVVSIGVAGEMLSMVPSRDPAGPRDLPVLATLLVGCILGTLVGTVIGSLEAVVLRKVAFGTGTWIICSAVAYGLSMLLIVGSEGFLPTRDELAGEVANQALYFFAGVFASLIMLFALWRLRSPLSRAAQHF